MDRRLRRAASVAACAALVGGTATACFDDASAMPAVRDFLVAWQVGNYPAAAGHTVGADRAAVARALAGVRDQLDAASMKLSLGVSGEPGQDPPRAITKSGDKAQALFSVQIDLGENGEPFTYRGQLDLSRVDGKWKIVWSPSVIHPELREGQRLAVVSETLPRADVQDSQGRTMLKPAKVTYVGVYPGQLSDPQQTVEQLAKVTQTDGQQLDVERLVGRVRSAPPNQFLNLMMLQKSEHPKMIKRLKAITGVQVQTRTVPFEPVLAPELVGGLGPATAERLQVVGAPYQPGDTIGVAGLQFLFQRRLAGTPTVRVVAQDPGGTGQPTVLRQFIGRAQPEPVRTTIDRSTQVKAEKALAGLNVPASLIAIRPNNGEILAVANHRTAGRNLAMEGQYPPGHTFGIVSAEALMQSAGVSDRDTRTECPATTTVGGRTFTNPGPARAENNFQRHFAYSCTTTLAQLSTKLTAPALAQAANLFGFGRNWGLSVPAFTGTVPTPANDGDKAAVATGQGGVLASPLGMALTAAAVATGTWRPPTLLQQPADRPALAPQFLVSGVIDDLQRLMQQSVRIGTAKAAAVRGPVGVHGVASTGTYTDPSGKTKTVSWFVGYRGSYAFAIAIEGSVNAAQIAKRFLTVN